MEPLIIIKIPTIWKKLKKIFLEIKNKLRPASKSITPTIIESGAREDAKVNNPLKIRKRAR
jgi:hypothetical protein